MNSARPSGGGTSRRAVVLGASMAGLLAARVLSETFDEVVLVERDPLDATGHRKGTPQSHHTHALLAKGLQVIEGLFPGLRNDLVDEGATVVDQVGDINWYNGPQVLARTPTDLHVLSLSRPALEDYLRGRVRKLAGVEIRGGLEATGLVAGGDKSVVSGVMVVAAGSDETETIDADLVVDTTGRGNRSRTWLIELGYEPAPEESVKAGICYSTRQYVRNKPLTNGVLASVGTVLSDAHPYSAAMVPMEGDRWIVTLIGLAADPPPTDVEGYERYSRRMRMTEIDEIIAEAEPLTDPRPFRVPASVRRHYENVQRLPQGYLVMGDALCAFNPVYGQGMTVAAVEATLLRDCLRESEKDLPRRFYKLASTFIDGPWDVATGGDLALSSTEGKRTAQIKFVNGYVAKVLHAAATEPTVGHAFHKTINLISRPESLFAPAVLRRVLFPRRAR